MNYAASRAITESFSLGVNGYYCQQLTNDRINGKPLAHTTKNQLYICPGFYWAIDQRNMLTFNLYLPVTTHGVANGPQLNLWFIHPS